GNEGQRLAPRTVWYQVRLGHFYLDHGRVDEANRQFEAAVAALPDYFLALAGLAEVRAAQGRYDDAIAAYRRTIAVAPDPIFFMAIGDIQTKLGHADEARKEYEQAEKLILESNATPAEYSRELSLFYSQRNLKPERALELAKTDLTFRQDLHGHDALAWALYRNKLYSEAAEAIEQALRWGTKEARLHYHAGMIRLRLGQTDRAREHLEQALAINPQFSVLDADEARRVLDELPKKPTGSRNAE
ncbi:MAG TPA: tetratricopeptide repeat protein, partial [Planctomycetaceae bacterium]|nr:tetratricopeptide repeat protein [Planctomycetaceae bacterium]